MTRASDGSVSVGSGTAAARHRRSRPKSSSASNGKVKSSSFVKSSRGTILAPSLLFGNASTVQHSASVFEHSQERDEASKRAFYLQASGHGNSGLHALARQPSDETDHTFLRAMGDDLLQKEKPVVSEVYGNVRRSNLEVPTKAEMRNQHESLSHLSGASIRGSSISSLHISDQIVTSEAMQSSTKPSVAVQLQQQSESRAKSSRSSVPHVSFASKWFMDGELKSLLSFTLPSALWTTSTHQAVSLARETTNQEQLDSIKSQIRISRRPVFTEISYEAVPNQNDGSDEEEPESQASSHFVHAFIAPDGVHPVAPSVFLMAARACCRVRDTHIHPVRAVIADDTMQPLGFLLSPIHGSKPISTALRVCGNRESTSLKGLSVYDCATVALGVFSALRSVHSVGKSFSGCVTLDNIWVRQDGHASLSLASVLQNWYSHAESIHDSKGDEIFATQLIPILRRPTRLRVPKEEISQADKEGETEVELLNPIPPEIVQALRFEPNMYASACWVNENDGWINADLVNDPRRKNESEDSQDLLSRARSSSMHFKHDPYPSNVILSTAEEKRIDVFCAAAAVLQLFCPTHFLANHAGSSFKSVEVGVKATIEKLQLVCPPLAELLLKCLSSFPLSRPSSSDCVMSLSYVLECLESKTDSQIQSALQMYSHTLACSQIKVDLTLEVGQTAGEKYDLILDSIPNITEVAAALAKSESYLQQAAQTLPQYLPNRVSLSCVHSLLSELNRQSSYITETQKTLIESIQLSAAVRKDLERSIKEEFSSADSLLHEKETSLRQERSKRLSILSEIQQWQDKFSIADKNNQRLEAKLADYSKRNQDLTNENHELKRLVEKLKGSNSELDTLASTCQEGMASVWVNHIKATSEASVREQALHRQIDVLKSIVAAAETSEHGVHNQLMQVRTLNLSLHDKAERLIQNEQSLKSRISHLLSVQGAINDQMNASNARIATLEARLEHQGVEIDNLNSTLSSVLISFIRFVGEANGFVPASGDWQRAIANARQILGPNIMCITSQSLSRVQTVTLRTAAESHHIFSGLPALFPCLINLTLQDGSSISSQVFDSVFSSLSNLKQVELVHCKHLTSTSVWSLLRGSCRRLILRHSNVIASDNENESCDFLPALTCFHASHCSDISESFLFELLRSCHCLRDIKLFCNGIHLHSNVIKFMLESADTVCPIQPGTNSLHHTRFSCLSFLEIGPSAVRLDDTAMPKGLANLRALKSLTISGCTGIGPLTLMAIRALIHDRSYQSLCALSLQNCGIPSCCFWPLLRAKDESPDRFTSVELLPKASLKHLNLQGNGFSWFLFHLISQVFPELETFKAGFDFERIKFPWKRAVLSEFDGHCLCSVGSLRWMNTSQSKSMCSMTHTRSPNNPDAKFHVWDPAVSRSAPPEFPGRPEPLPCSHDEGIHCQCNESKNNDWTTSTPFCRICGQRRLPFAVLASSAPSFSLPIAALLSHFPCLKSLELMESLACEPVMKLPFSSSFAQGSSASRQFASVPSQYPSLMMKAALQRGMTSFKVRGCYQLPSSAQPWSWLEQSLESGSLLASKSVALKGECDGAQPNVQCFHLGSTGISDVGLNRVVFGPNVSTMSDLLLSNEQLLSPAAVMSAIVRCDRLCKFQASKCNWVNDAFCQMLSTAPFGTRQRLRHVNLSGCLSITSNGAMALLGLPFEVDGVPEALELSEGSLSFASRRLQQSAMLSEMHGFDSGKQISNRQSPLDGSDQSIQDSVIHSQLLPQTSSCISDAEQQASDNQVMNHVMNGHGLLLLSSVDLSHTSVDPWFVAMCAVLSLPNLEDFVAANCITSEWSVSSRQTENVYVRPVSSSLATKKARSAANRSVLQHLKQLTMSGRSLSLIDLTGNVVDDHCRDGTVGVDDIANDVETLRLCCKQLCSAPVV